MSSRGLNIIFAVVRFLNHFRSAHFVASGLHIIGFLRFQGQSALSFRDIGSLKSDFFVAVTLRSVVVASL